jgi:hypothetical protein
MKKDNLFDIIKAILRILPPIAVGTGLVIGIVAVDLTIYPSPHQIAEIKQAQKEVAIIRMKAERDKAEFNRLRRKHGLAATAVVIYEPEKTPYYYGFGKEKIALK